jgi:hypothetical protein
MVILGANDGNGLIPASSLSEARKTGPSEK